jgi:hypothetical protein
MQNMHRDSSTTHWNIPLVLHGPTETMQLELPVHFRKAADANYHAGDLESETAIGSMHVHLDTQD